jgi:hypothetical protein
MPSADGAALWRLTYTADSTRIAAIYANINDIARRHVSLAMISIIDLLAISIVIDASLMLLLLIADMIRIWLSARHTHRASQSRIDKIKHRHPA